MTEKSKDTATNPEKRRQHRSDDNFNTSRKRHRTAQCFSEPQDEGVIGAVESGQSSNNDVESGSRDDEHIWMSIDSGPELNPSSTDAEAEVVGHANSLPVPGLAETRHDSSGISAFPSKDPVDLNKRRRLTTQATSRPSLGPQRKTYPTMSRYPEFGGPALWEGANSRPAHQHNSKKGKFGERACEPSAVRLSLGLFSLDDGKHQYSNSWYTPEETVPNLSRIIEERRDSQGIHGGFRPTNAKESALDKNMASVLFDENTATDDHHSRFQWHLIFEDLPQKRNCHALFRCFITGVYPLMPILHLQSLLIRYEMFWTSLDGNGTASSWLPTPRFMALLFAILYAGSISCSAGMFQSEFLQQSKSSLSVQLRHQVARWLKMTDFPQTPTLCSLIAFLITETVSTRECRITDSALAIMLQTAQKLGLHRDPDQFDIEPVLGELRRRVWWHIVEADTLSSTTTGTAPLISIEKYCDTQDISEVADSYVATREGKNYQRAVLSGGLQPLCPANPLSDCGSSIVSVIYLVAHGANILGSECLDQYIDPLADWGKSMQEWS